MADWRQIQARIRKAKNSPDAPAKLSELFQRTRDAMVAWELGALEEKAEHTAEAGNWYTIAAQRFRRADWKKKAEEALTRLGLELPPPHERPDHSVATTSESLNTSPPATHEIDPATTGADEGGEILSHPEDAAAPVSPSAGAENGTVLQSARKKRRRGRRGGRGRRRKDGLTPSRLPAQAFAAATASPTVIPEPSAPPVVMERQERVAPPSARATPAATIEAPAPRLVSERSAQSRAGDPALASRMAQLESMLRRLVTSPAHRLDESDEAPASPGVLLLSDSDQITSYYVESCQTLRIACGNLVRSGRAGKNPRAGRGGYPEGGLKEKLGEYLGISETKVSQYMKDHCVIRWIQLDDEAPLLAHFAIGVLRTPLNLE
ncbi:MAG TPA: hypothetical protein VGR97_09830 [Candidatus Acidoferrales bacterium]|nr:hypothetical protein [Candidatus Acidoferrales bacterium]